MPLWDSVQRGLEKATQEATRMARTQRLRLTIDGLSRQLNTQHNTIFNKTMELFANGQLTQSELLPLCQEMVNLQQQLNQAQNELKQLQASQAQTQTTGPQTQTGTANPYLSPAGEAFAPTSYAPPPPEYQTYLNITQGAGVPDVPPPPPGMEPPTISAIETIQMNMGAKSSSETRLCSVCQTELLPNNAFCHNCGAPMQTAGSVHQPTMRAGYMPAPTSADVSTEETRRAATPNAPLNPSDPEHSASTPPDYPPTTRGERPVYPTPPSDVPGKPEPMPEDSSPVDDASSHEAAQNEGV